jgi:hypothetical protein
MNLKKTTNTSKLKRNTRSNDSTIFSNIEIVTIAVYLLGGDSKYIDTEDIAVKVNELAPGRCSKS